jgi:hypothetical protein
LADELSRSIHNPSDSYSGIVSDTPSLADLLVNTPLRERSGTQASNRFSFQRSWAIGLITSLHDSGNDYCVLFDFHDDVVALDHSTAPTGGEFYQIKTKGTGNWTEHQLTERKKGKDGLKPSILGKMYQHVSNFADKVRRLAFVSNAHMGLAMHKDPKGADRAEIKYEDIRGDEKEKIRTKLQAELGLASPPTHLHLLHLETTSLSLTDHETHTEGVLSGFLSKQGDGTIPPQPFHRCLRSEIERRNNKECSPTTFPELCKLKGLTRDEFQGMMDSIMSQPAKEDVHTFIRSQLIEEHYPITQLPPLVAKVRAYLTQRQDLTNLLLADAAKWIRLTLLTILDAPSSEGPLTHILNTMSTRNSKESDAIVSVYGHTYLLAMFAVLFYDQTISTAYSQPKAQDP